MELFRFPKARLGKERIVYISPAICDLLDLKPGDETELEINSNGHVIVQPEHFLSMGMKTNVSMESILDRGYRKVDG